MQRMRNNYRSHIYEHEQYLDLSTIRPSWKHKCKVHSCEARIELPSYTLNTLNAESLIFVDINQIG